MQIRYSSYFEQQFRKLIRSSVKNKDDQSYLRSKTRIGFFRENILTAEVDIDRLDSFSEKQYLDLCRILIEIQKDQPKINGILVVGG